MKIFDSAPGIALEQPSRRWTIASAVVGVATFSLLVGIVCYQNAMHTAQLKTVSTELAAAKDEVTRLNAALAEAKQNLDATQLKINTCASTLNAEASKVSAFAKQAAACEVIRNKIHLKG